MLLTPTFHVFEMYKPHQGGQSVRVSIECDDVSFAVGEQRHGMPILSGSASVKNNVLTLSVTNCHSNLPADVMIDLRGAEVREMRATVLTNSDITAHNTLDHPEQIKPDTRIAAAACFKLAPASATVMHCAIGK